MSLIRHEGDYVRKTDVTASCVEKFSYDSLS